MSLSETDACRFSVVVEDAARRLDLLRCLQKQARSAQVGKRSAATTATMTSLLQTQSDMQDKYGRLSARRQTSSANPRSDELSRRLATDLDQELADTAENLRYCRRSIAQAMGAEDPEHVRKLAEIGTESAALSDQLKQLVFDLSEPERRFASLSEKVWRCRSQEQQLKETLQRQSAAEAQRQALEAELRQIEDQFVERNGDIDAAIAQLTDDLKRRTDDLAVQLKLESDVSVAAINTAQRLCQRELDAIRNEMARCEADNDREAKVSAKTREFLERQTEHNRSKLASWEAKFAEELAEKKDELAQLRAQHSEAIEQLDQLETRWTFECDAERRSEREAAEARIQADKDAGVRRLENAACTIQKAWRRAQHARAERAAQKKKKKSGKSRSGKAGKRT